MGDVRFIQKDGQSVDCATVRRRFFEAAVAATVHPDRVCRIWKNAMFGKATPPTASLSKIAWSDPDYQMIGSRCASAVST